MSKKFFAGSDKKQPSLLGFVSKKSTIDATDKSPSVFGTSMRSQRLLTENGQSATSTPSTFGAATVTSKSKFKYVPAKRKSESLIEISDDSRSPTKIEIQAPKRTHLIESDDEDLFDFDVKTAKVTSQPVDDDDVEKKLAAVYAKYDTPKKQQPVKTTAIQLTPEDKLNLDKALNMNDAYAKAQKKLDENLQQVQQSSRIITTKTGVGKFKFNRPSAALNVTGGVSAESVSDKSLVPTSEVQSLWKPAVSSKPKSVAATVTSSTATAISEPKPTAPAASSYVAPPKPQPLHAAVINSSSLKPTTRSNKAVDITTVVTDTPKFSNHNPSKSTVR